MIRLFENDTLSGYNFIALSGDCDELIRQKIQDEIIVYFLQTLVTTTILTYLNYVAYVYTGVVLGWKPE